MFKSVLLASLANVLLAYHAMLPEALRTCGSRSFSLPKSPHHHSRTLGAKLASHVNENLSSDRLIVCLVWVIKSGLAGPADWWNPGGPPFVGRRVV